MASLVSHFCSAAGDQKAIETEGNNRRGKRGGGGEKAGLREFAGSLVYSVVVLTSEWTPADTGRWRLACVHVKEPLMHLTSVSVCEIRSLILCLRMYCMALWGHCKILNSRQQTLKVTLNIELAFLDLFKFHLNSLHTKQNF